MSDINTLILLKFLCISFFALCSCSKGKHYHSFSLNMINYLVILGPPKIKPFLLNSDFDLNHPFVTSCLLASGERPVSFEWLKNGKKISNDDRIIIRYEQAYSVIEIKQLVNDDIGNYTCIAQNSLGSDEYTSELIIRCEYSCLYIFGHFSVCYFG